VESRFEFAGPSRYFYRCRQFAEWMMEEAMRVRDVYGRIGRTMMGFLAAVALSGCGSDGDSGTDTTTGDTPSGTDSAGGDAAGAPLIAVNEVQHKALDDGPDWIELFNPGTSALDLTGWIIKDSDGQHTFTFPSGTSIGAGAFLLVYGEGGTGSLVFGYGLGNYDAVRLFNASKDLIDVAAWGYGDAENGQTWGRFPDGYGAFATLASPTPGEPNKAP